MADSVNAAPPRTICAIVRPLRAIRLTLHVMGTNLHCRHSGNQYTRITTLRFSDRARVTAAESPCKTAAGRVSAYPCADRRCGLIPAVVKDLSTLMARPDDRSQFESKRAV